MSTTNNQDRDRKGDTSRTSDQGRKLASGGDTDKRSGNPEIDEDTKNVKSEEIPETREKNSESSEKS